MGDHVRRTLRIEGARRKELETIRKSTGAATDTAAINEAVEFRARYANCDPKKIDLGLWLLGQIDVIDRTSPIRTVTMLEPVPPGAPDRVHHIPVPNVA